jgi:hypothetical protein
MPARPSTRGFRGASHNSSARRLVKSRHTTPVPPGQNRGRRPAPPSAPPLTAVPVRYEEEQQGLLYHLDVTEGYAGAHDHQHDHDYDHDRGHQYQQHSSYDIGSHDYGHNVNVMWDDAAGDTHVHVHDMAKSNRPRTGNLKIASFVHDEIESTPRLQVPTYNVNVHGCIHMLIYVHKEVRCIVFVHGDSLSAHSLPTCSLKVLAHYVMGRFAYEHMHTLAAFVMICAE